MEEFLLAQLKELKAEISELKSENKRLNEKIIDLLSKGVQNNSTSVKENNHDNYLESILDKVDNFDTFISKIKNLSVIETDIKFAYQSQTDAYLYIFEKYFPDKKLRPFQVTDAKKKILVIKENDKWTNISLEEFIKYAYRIMGAIEVSCSKYLTQKNFKTNDEAWQDWKSNVTIKLYADRNEFKEKFAQKLFDISKII